MRLTQHVVALCVITMFAPNQVWARSTIDSRVDRLENIVANEYNSKLLNQMEAMQQEIRELRGKIEEQQNTIHSLNQKQEKLYINLDDRLNKINTNPVVPEQSAPVDTGVQTQASQVQPPNQILPAEIPGTSEKALYDAAMQMLRDKKYAQAIVEFKDLLWQFPEGTYACDSYYWLGELYRMQWHTNKTDQNLLNQAKDAFNTVLNKYQGLVRGGR